VDKFNEFKDKAGDMADDAKDKAEDLYNKAKDSPMGDKLDDVSDQVKEKAQGLLSKFKGDKGAELVRLPLSQPAEDGGRTIWSARRSRYVSVSAVCASSRCSGATGRSGTGPSGGRCRS
jgi:hypothetical protein